LGGHYFGNSVADVALADSSAPTFANMVNGQINLRDAIKRQIDFESGGKQYKLSENPAVLIVRSVVFHVFDMPIYFDLSRFLT
jgi:malate synthase